MAAPTCVSQHIRKLPKQLADDPSQPLLSILALRGAAVLVSFRKANLGSMQAAQMAKDGDEKHWSYHEDDGEDFSGPVCVVACGLVESPARVEAHIAWQDTVMMQAGVQAS